MRLILLAAILLVSGCDTPSRAERLGCVRADGSGFSIEARFWKYSHHGYWWSPDTKYKPALNESCSVVTVNKGRSL